MTDILEIVRVKELRRRLIDVLYKAYGEKITMRAFRNLLKYRGYYTRLEIRKALDYLCDKGFAKAEFDGDFENFWDASVWLLPPGVNLAEGDIEDAGVMADE